MEVVYKCGGIFDSMFESDLYLIVMENSIFWCEICEISGYDIFICINMFGFEVVVVVVVGKLLINGNVDYNLFRVSDVVFVLLFFVKGRFVWFVFLGIKILLNLMEFGLVVGKESGIMDLEKWCVVCECDGYDSVDCLFEDVFWIGKDVVDELMIEVEREREMMFDVIWCDDICFYVDGFFF